MGDKCLSAEAGVNRHEHHEVEVGRNFFEHADRRVRIERHARHHARVLDLLHHAVQVRAGLIVHVHHFCAERLDLRQELLRLHDHQVHVERFPRGACHGFHNGEAERYVGNEHAVHHVEVKPVARATIKHLDVALQVAEVGRKQGGGNKCHTILYIYAGAKGTPEE